jgi:hypothetical protein
MPPAFCLLRLPPVNQPGAKARRAPAVALVKIVIKPLGFDRERLGTLDHPLPRMMTAESVARRPVHAP